MPFYPHKNLAESTVATAPSPASSGTSLVLAAGTGAYYPQPSTDGSFPIAFGPNSGIWNPGNTEIALCTARATDTLTLTRAQFGTSARTIIVGDVADAGLTLETLRQYEIGQDLPGVVQMFGADPTGVASSTTAFQNAINAGSFRIEAGTYKVGLITYTGAADGAGRRIQADGPVTIIQTDINGVFDLRGSWTVIGNATGGVNSMATVSVAMADAGETASANSLVTQLTLAANGSVTRGDVCKFVADDIPTWNRVGSTWRTGEYMVVGLTTAGTNLVTFASRVLETYTTGMRVAKLNDVKFTIDGPIIFDTDPAIRNTTVWGAVYSLRATKFSTINGIEFRNSLGRAIGNYAYGTHINACRFINLANRPTLSHYGYGLQDGGTITRMSNCYSIGGRHQFSEGCVNTNAGEVNFEYFGGAYFGNISACVAHSAQSQGFDTHSTSYGTTFIGCTAVGSSIGASSGGYGFSFRGRRVTAKDCTASNCQSGFNICGSDNQLINCDSIAAIDFALQISGDTDDATLVTNIKGIKIIGGRYESTASYHCCLIGTAGYNIECRLDQVTFQAANILSGWICINIVAPASVRVQDITLDMTRQVSAQSGNMFQLADAGAVVTGHDVDILLGAGAVNGFQFLETSGTGNTGVFAVEGMRLDCTTGIIPSLNFGSDFYRMSWAYRNGSGATNDQKSSECTTAVVAQQTATFKSITANVATITTNTTHNYVVGQHVLVAISDAVFDGYRVITSTPTGTTFRFNRTNADVANTAASGTVTIAVPTTYVADRVAVCTLTGSAGNQTIAALAAIAGTRLLDGQIVEVVNQTNGVVTVGTLPPIPVNATGRFEYINSGTPGWISLGVTLGGNVTILSGATIPEGNIVASPGAIYLQTDGQLWRKMIGTATNTGWIALVPAHGSIARRSVQPGSSTTIQSLGIAVQAAVGTISHPAPATGSTRAKATRFVTTSSASAGSFSECRSVARNFAGEVGFAFTVTFGIETSQSGMRKAFGVRGSTSAATNVDPATVINQISIGAATDTGNLQLYAAGGSAQSAIDLGANFAQNTTDLFEFRVIWPAGGSTAYYWVKNLTTNNVASGSLTGAQLPSLTTYLAMYNWATNNATASAIAVAIGRFDIDSQY
jgi:hypothetical protein